LELEQDFFQNFGLFLVLIGLILENKPSGIRGEGGGVDSTYGFETQP
jgi:hypothetical protein